MYKRQAIKIHFGEPGNLSFLRPNYAKAVADVVKELGGRPFLTDCNTLYVGRRKDALEHLSTAYENGFNLLSTGCHIIIGDGLKGTDDVCVPVELSLIHIFINALAGKACAKTGNKPGVTKGKQWIRLNKNVELLDTPGILWPKFEDQTVGLKLAFIGSIKDEILQTEELAAELVKFLNSNYPGTLEEQYGIGGTEDAYERCV